MVYFGDDDNTYDYRLFHEFCSVDAGKEDVGFVPVGFIKTDGWDDKVENGVQVSHTAKHGSIIECESRRVVHFHPNFVSSRTFAVDFAAISFTVKSLLNSNRIKSVFFDRTISEGMSETEFVCRLLNLEIGESCDHGGFETVPLETKNKIVGLANDCRDIFVWHTKTVYPGFSSV